MMKTWKEHLGSMAETNKYIEAEPTLFCKTEDKTYGNII